MYTKIITTLSCFLLSISVYSQSVSIKGKVTNKIGEPVTYASVTFQNTTFGTTTNDHGNYAFETIPAGKYNLVVTAVGYKDYKKAINIQEDAEPLLLDITMERNSHSLDEVTVFANTNGIANKESDMVARMPLKNMENPQVYSIVGKELIKQQAIIEMTDAFKQAPGVVATSYPSGGVGVVSRGFSTNAGARNGLQSDLGRSSADLINVERIEFIKGPSATLFGPSISSFGGVVNIVTKKPFEKRAIAIDYSMGSFNLMRLSADVNMPITKDAQFRINAAAQKKNHYKDYGFYNSYAFAPSFSYQASDRLSFNIDAEFYSVHSTRPTYTRINPKTGFKSFADVPLGYRISLYDNSIDAKTSSQKYFAEAKYKINSNWESSTNASFVTEQTHSSYQSYNTWLTKDSVIRYVGIWGPIENIYTNLQQNFIGRFNTGAAIKHKLLLGLNYGNSNAKGLSNFSNNFDTIRVDGKYNLISKTLANAILLTPKNVSSRGISIQNNYAAYVSDAINIYDRLFVLLSLRFDRFEQSGDGGWSAAYSQNALAPKFGIVYQPVKDKVSLFANYQSGYQNSGPVTQPDGTRLAIKPIFATQFEGGVKAELLDKRIGASLSYYRIFIDNAVRLDDNKFSIQDGQQVSKGIEAEVTANPVSGLNILLGYGYNDNRLVKAAANVGKLIAGAPQHIANYWLSYKIQNGSLKNIGFGAGGNYVGNSYFDASNTISLPTHNIINATAFYEVHKWRLGIKLNNITNQHAWDSYGMGIPTRNFVANISFKL